VLLEAISLLGFAAHAIELHELNKTVRASHVGSRTKAADVQRVRNILSCQNGKAISTPGDVTGIERILDRYRAKAIDLGNALSKSVALPLTACCEWH
jgi:hypothetical protein